MILTFSSIFFFILGIITLISLIGLKLELYFLNWDINKHPYIEWFIKNLLNNIAEKENVGVFELPMNEIGNNSKRCEKDHAYAAYLYFIPQNESDKKYIKESNEKYRSICILEKKYKKSYSELYHEIHGEEITREPYKYCIPRIEISEQVNRHHHEILYHYKAFAHEIGHHIAITQENDDSEKRADEIGADLIMENTPNYFKLIYKSLFNIVFSDNEQYGKKFKISGKREYLKLVWSYYRDYYLKRKKLNKEFEINT